MKKLLCVMRSQKNMSIKCLVLQCILYTEEGMHLQKAVDKVLLSTDIGAYRGVVTELCYGYFRYKIRLLGVLEVLLSAPNKLPKGVLVLLASTLYEILYMEECYCKNSVYTAVEAIKRAYGAWLANLANAVLRRAVRERAMLCRYDFFEEYAMKQYTVQEHALHFVTSRSKEERYRYFCSAIHYALPLFLWERLCIQKGEQAAHRCAAFLLERPVKTKLEPSITKGLENAQIQEAHKKQAYMQKISLQERIQSEVYPQYNTATEELYTRLGIKTLIDPGAKVWDICTGRGGKTSAFLRRGLPVQYVSDSFMGRLKRHMYPHLVRVKMDARKPAIRDAHLDCILADVPCTGSGTLRKRPDLRSKLTEAKLEELAVLQGAIISSLASKVRCGGLIVYSTCSMLCEENSQQIQHFLEKHPEYILIKEYTTQMHSMHNDILYGAVLQKTQ